MANKYTAAISPRLMNTIVISGLVIVSMFAYRFVTDAHKELQYVNVKGRNTASNSSSTLSSLQSLPLISAGSSASSRLSNTINDDIFSRAKAKPNEDAPINDKPVVPERVFTVDYHHLVHNHFSLGAIMNNGAIINQRFYRSGQTLSRTLNIEGKEVPVILRTVKASAITLDVDGNPVVMSLTPST